MPGRAIASTARDARSETGANRAIATRVDATRAATRAGAGATATGAAGKAARRIGNMPRAPNPRERDRPIDPNSPFAKLAALKEQLTAARKDP